MIGTDVSQIDAIFITHEHIDHTRALNVLTGRCPIPVHMTQASYTASGLSCPVITHPSLYSVKIGSLTVKSFPLSHDAACCVGYIATCDGCKVGVMTDTGYVTDEAVASLVGCTEVVVESNHDVDMLRHGKYPRVLQDRILSERGHLSNADCAEFCAFLAAKGTRRVILAHLSRDNNTPEEARRMAEQRIAQTGREVQIICAPQGIA